MHSNMRIPFIAAATAVAFLGGCVNETAAVEADGYRQVNTVLSEAYMNLIRTGQDHNICVYNAGFPPSEGTDLEEQCREDMADPDDCNRRWDGSAEPAGILNKIVSTGTFKWCVPEANCGPAKDGFIEISPKDDFLQNVKEGEYYGSEIDYYNALTIEMGNILKVPLKSEIVVIRQKDDIFDDVYSALKSDKCYATGADYFRQ